LVDRSGMDAFLKHDAGQLKFPTTEPARRIMILAALRLRGQTMGTIARELACSRKTTATALYRAFPRMEREIATRLGTTPEAIWPERYAARIERAARRGGGR